MYKKILEVTIMNLKLIIGEFAKKCLKKLLYTVYIYKKKKNIYIYIYIYIYTQTYIQSLVCVYIYIYR